MIPSEKISKFAEHVKLRVKPVQNITKFSILRRAPLFTPIYINLTTVRTYCLQEMKCAIKNMI